MKKKKEEDKKDEAPQKKENIDDQIKKCKAHLVTSFPDIKKVPITEKLDFIIVACDGIWDCFTNE